MGVNRALPSLCRDCFSHWETQVGPDNGRCQACGGRRVVSHAGLSEFTIAHIDCDAFFAAIHKRDQPELRDKAVIVGGGKRGVVATCCYLARASGVRSAMPMFKALKLCPEAVVIPPQMSLYAKEGKAIRQAMQALTPLVEAVSIDEAYLDLSGTEKMHHGSAAETLARFQSRIEADHGLTVSVGLSCNKFLAKTASDLDKPRGFAILAPEDVPTLIWPRSVGFLHGVGPAFVKALNRDGFQCVGDLAAVGKEDLIRRYGDGGLRLFNMAHGTDTRRVEPETERKSISTETTFHHDLVSREDLEPLLQSLCAKLGAICRGKGHAGRVLTLKLKTAGFQTITRRLTLSEPTATGYVMLDALRPLLLQELKRGPFRLMGVGVSDLGPLEGADQGDLLNQSAPRRAALERALDSVHARFGKAMVRTLRS